MNTEQSAKKWMEFLVARPEFPAPQSLLTAWNSGAITRLCDCSEHCQSFSFHVSDGNRVVPLWTAGGSGGAVFTIDFRITTLESEPADRTLELVVFVDERGHFDGIDVMCSCNTLPVPEQFVVHEPPIRVSGALRDA